MPSAANTGAGAGAAGVATAVDGFARGDFRTAPGADTVPSAALGDCFVRAAGVFTLPVGAALVVPLTGASGVTAAAGTGASTGPVGGVEGGTGGGIEAVFDVRGFRGALFRVAGTVGVVSLVAGGAGTVGRFF